MEIVCNSYWPPYTHVPVSRDPASHNVWSIRAHEARVLLPISTVIRHQY